MKSINKILLLSLFVLGIFILSFSAVQACEQKGELKNTEDTLLTKGDCHEYSISLPAKGYLEISAQQKGVDFEINVFSAGNQIKSADSGNTNTGFEFIAITTPTSNDYKVQIKWLDDQQTYLKNEGFYKLGVKSNFASEQDITFTEKFENADFLFTKANAETKTNVASATNDFLSAVEIYKSLPKSAIFKYKSCLANYFLGRFYNSTKRYKEATLILEENVNLAAEIQDSLLESWSLKELGIAFYNTRDLQKSSEIFDRTIFETEKLYRDKIGEIKTLPAVYILSAETLLGLNKPEKAITLLEKIRLNHQDSVEEYLRASIKLADVYFDLSNEEKAGQILSSIVLPEKASREAKGYFNKVSGKLFIKTNKENALRFFNKALEYFSDNRLEKAEIKMFTGNVYYYAKDFPNAQRFYEEAKVTFEAENQSFNLAQTLNNLGVIYYSREETQIAISTCENALMINVGIQNELNKARNLLNLMYFQEKAGNNELAVFYGKWAINSLQTIKYQELQNLEKDVQTAFKASFVDAFRELASILIKEGRISEAEQVLRVVKEKEFLDYVRGNSSIESIDFTKQEEELLRKVTNRTEKKPLSSNDEKFNTSFETVSPTKKMIADLESQNIDVSHTLFVSTIVAKNSLSLIVTTNTVQSVVTHAITSERLNELVLEFREAVMDTEISPKISGRKLYDLLVKPLENKLAEINATKIVWSLDGSLQYVSIPALYDGKNYLIHRFANVQLTFTSNEKVLFPKIEYPSAIGLASSKSFENLSSLPIAKNELDCIFEDDKKLIINSACKKGIMKGKKFADEDFTSDKFEEALKGFQLVHLTSHFVLQTGDISKSFFLLGGGKDRKYTMSVFANQRLDNVEMITMSACNTANLSSNGSEFESFAALAQKQGAKAVLATLWSVADISTSKFMTEFYRLYEVKRFDKAESIRKAQIFLSKDKNYSHPFYWAPFVLFGNWK